METALCNKLTPSLPFSLHLHRPFFSPSVSSLSFPLSSKIPSLSSSSSSNLLVPRHPISEPNAFFSLLRTTTIAATVTAAILLARFNMKAAIAAPVRVEDEVLISDEDKEKNLEEYLKVNSYDDVEALKNLMEIKIKSNKVEEAIRIIDELIELEPEDNEWPLLKSHLYCYNGDTESAKIGFNDILSKDPLRVEAYHGLVMAATAENSSSSNPQLEDVEKMIREGAKMVKKENKIREFRDFMLLLAQVQVFRGDFDNALAIYKDLVKEEPRDFRPYVCQSIIYGLMGKKDEAEKSFNKYRRLVPKGHPYAQYFDQNLNASKLFENNQQTRLNV